MLGRAAGRPDVAVVGGGPIGLAIAWRCAARGMRVTLYDPAPGSGAAAVAAGMLSPVAESHFGESALTRLMLDSAARWPAFAAELSALTGHDLGYRDDGTLVVALTIDDAAEAGRLIAYQRELGLPITPLPPSRLRAHEPLLAPRVRGGAYAPDDHQVDPRRLTTALRAAAVGAGVTLLPELVEDVSTVEAGAVVVAAGHRAAALTGMPVRAVKGQILRLHAPGGAAPGFRHVIRGYADGRSVYLVPRRDGEVVVGATVEERADTFVTVGGVLELLRAATDLVPELAEYDLVEASAGLRPGTPDNAPIIGPLPGGKPAGGDPRQDRSGAARRLVVATGHHRHGILLAPVTAELVTDLLATGVVDPALAPFTPDRFVAQHRADRAGDRPA